MLRPVAAAFFSPAMPYLASAAALFAVEVAIAVGVIPGVFVRGSLGDVLAVALVYTVFRAPFSRERTLRLLVLTALASFAVGAVLELAQALRLADALGLSRGGVLRILLGDTASWSDVAMYAVGGFGAWVADYGTVVLRNGDSDELPSDASD